VQDICLLPGLVSVPDDGISYLVIPEGEGVILYAADAPPEEWIMPIWSRSNGARMPFVGAVRGRTFNEPISALALITDSAYGAFHLAGTPDSGAALETHYSRDPERRRLDIRLVVLPEQNHIGVARAYRNKIIIDRNHVTLRQKMRERPEIEKLIGATFFMDQQPPDGYSGAAVAVRYRSEIAADAICLTELESGLSAPHADNESLWNLMDSQLEILKERAQKGSAIGASFSGDWSAVACDFWLNVITSFRRGFYRAAVPLYCVVYHDSVVAISPNDPMPSDYNFIRAVRFLQSVLRLSLPSVTTPSGNINDDISLQQLHCNISVLGPLHRLSFAAFLSEHRFLSPNLKVEEARYTNGAYVIVNQSDTDHYENDRVTLPPLGFYVEHPQIIAHDAVRVGAEQFNTRAFRITRSQDGKPLSASADVLRQEFPV
jgi:hypothetical protein